MYIISHTQVWLYRVRSGFDVSGKIWRKERQNIERRGRHSFFGPKGKGVTQWINESRSYVCFVKIVTIGYDDTFYFCSHDWLHVITNVSKTEMIPITHVPVYNTRFQFILSRREREVHQYNNWTICNSRQTKSNVRRKKGWKRRETTKR